MGVTSNYSFPVPVATDLVKDGWDAINDLGVAVDTAMNTALGTKKAGMVLLNTTSFSGVASQSFNNVFSATYDHYLLKTKLVASGGDVACPIRFRASGTDNSTANYHWFVSFFTSNTAIERQINTGQTSSTFNNANASGAFADILIYSPFLAEPTYISVIENGAESATQPRYLFRRGQHNVSSSFDGFTITPTSGTITGYISIYGFND